MTFTLNKTTSAKCYPIVSMGAVEYRQAISVISN